MHFNIMTVLHWPCFTACFDSVQFALSEQYWEVKKETGIHTPYFSVLPLNFVKY